MMISGHRAWEEPPLLSRITLRISYEATHPCCAQAVFLEVECNFAFPWGSQSIQDLSQTRHGILG